MATDLFLLLLLISYGVLFWTGGFIGCLPFALSLGIFVVLFSFRHTIGGALFRTVSDV